MIKNIKIMSATNAKTVDYTSSTDLDLAYGMGVNCFVYLPKPPVIAAIKAGGIDYLQQMIDKAHSRGMTIIMGMGPEYYTSNQTKNAFLTEPAAKTNFLVDMDWLLNKNIDGFMLHEPTPNGAVVNCETWRTFLNAFFLECDTKIKARKNMATFTWGFASGSNSPGVCGSTPSGLAGMGIDFAFYRANNIFNHIFISTPTNSSNPGLDTIANNWLSFLPGRTFSETLYIPIGGTNTNLNPYFIPQFTYAVSKGYPILVFTTGYANAYKLGAQIKTIWDSIISPTGILDISSTPAGAGLRLKFPDMSWGNYGITPRKKELPSGNYVAELTLARYETALVPFVIAAGQTTFVNQALVLVTPPCVPKWQCEVPLNGYESDGCGNRQLNSRCNPVTTGSLDIRSIPPEALVYVDGLYKGITNVLIEGLEPGTRTIKLTKTGFEDVDGTVLIEAGTIQMQEYTLIQSHGTLFISSIPVADAKVFLDNEDTLQVTPAVLLVSPGTHSIKLVRSGFNDAIELNIPVEADQTISKIYTLLPLSGGAAGTVITVTTGLAVGTTLYGIGKLLKR